MFKRLLKEFLTFAKWEQRGILILLGLIFLLILFQVVYHPKPQIYFAKDVSAIVAQFEKDVRSSNPKNRYNSEVWDRVENKQAAPEPFFFDPNTVSIRELCSLGFSPKQADAIDRYRKKGGGFKTPADFQRMYVVSPAMFNRLAPYIQISIAPKDTLKPATAYKRELVLVDLNGADTAQLNALKGIGPTLAARIVAYRDRLGGFVRPEQVREVYGIDSARYEMFKNQLRPLSGWTRIKINSVTLEELKGHPYLNAYLARNIIYYRSKRGSIANIQQLVDDRIISKECSERLKDYIDCSN